MTRIAALVAGSIGLLALSGGVGAQTNAGTEARGSVRDAASGTAVAGAAVFWLPEGATEPRGRVTTDADGRLSVPRSWGSDGRVEVRALGYRGLELSADAAEDVGWDLVLERDPLELESIVVTVSGRAQRRSEIAISLARISREEIESSGASSAEALLAEIPGLQQTSAAPVGSNIMIRGIGDSRVLVLLDGEPVGGALIENRDLSRLSLAGVDRVEVVKGPLSSLYGSDALGGVVNVITTDPEAGFRMDGRLLSGGLGRKEGEITLAGGADARFRVTGAWRQEDRVPGLSGGEDAFARVWDLRGTTRYGFSGLRGRTDVSYLRERQRWPVGGGFSGFNDNQGITAWTELAGDAGLGTWSLRLFGQTYDHLYRSARGTQPIAGGGEDRQEEDLLKGTLRYTARLGAHELDLGIEAAHRSIRSPDKILQDNAADDQLELFAQDGWRLGGTTLSGGARVTFNDRWGDTVSPTFGMSSGLAEGVRVRASLGRGFRAPSFKELAWDFANVGAGYTVQGFSDLEPEASWNFTTGVDWAPTDAVRITVEAYHHRIRDLIETGFVGSTESGLLIYSPRNVSRARTRGVELSTAFMQGPWRVSGEYAFLDARSLGDDLPLDRRARHSARVQVGTLFGFWNGLDVEVTARWTGPAPLIGTGDEGNPAQIGVRGGLASIDAAASLGLGGGFRVLLGAENIFDSRPEGWEAGIGRRLRVGIAATDLF